MRIHSGRNFRECTSISTVYSNQNITCNRSLVAFLLDFIIPPVHINGKSALQI